MLESARWCRGHRGYTRDMANGKIDCRTCTTEISVIDKAVGKKGMEKEKAFWDKIKLDDNLYATSSVYLITWDATTSVYQTAE